MHGGPIHVRELTVLENGFEYDARPYESLSEINWGCLCDVCGMALEPYSLFGLANRRPRLHRCSMQIRKASVEDTVEACQVVRRSIAELCHADHQDDPIVLEKWLNNNTSDNMRSWIADPDSYVIVATEGAVIIGVGAVTSSGEITLNYVSPDARFRGVSKAILNQLEARALELGNNTCALTSTETARRFYLSAGYVQFGPSEPSIGKGSSYRMVKQLSLLRKRFSAI